MKDGREKLSVASNQEQEMRIGGGEMRVASSQPVNEHTLKFCSMSS